MREGWWVTSNLTTVTSSVFDCTYNRLVFGKAARGWVVGTFFYVCARNMVSRLARLLQRWWDDGVGERVSAPWCFRIHTNSIAFFYGIGGKGADDDSDKHRVGPPFRYVCSRFFGTP